MNNMKSYFRFPGSRTCAREPDPRTPEEIKRDNQRKYRESKNSDGIERPHHEAWMNLSNGDS